MALRDHADVQDACVSGRFIDRVLEVELVQEAVELSLVAAKEGVLSGAREVGCVEHKADFVAVGLKGQ